MGVQLTVQRFLRGPTTLTLLPVLVSLAAVGSAANSVAADLTCPVNFGGAAREVVWRTHAMDYNAMHGDGSATTERTVWSGVPLFTGTKLTFLEYCGRMRYCVPLGKGGNVYGSAMMSAYGLMSLLKPSSLPYVVDLGIYNWEFDGMHAAPGDNANRSIFRDDTHYIFCLNRTVPPQRSDNDERLYTVPELAEYIIGITELTPTFSAPAPNPVLDVTADSFMEYTVTRDWIASPDHVEFRLQSRGETFEWKTEHDSGSVSNSSLAVAMLIYALRTIDWRRLSDPSVAEMPSPADTLLQTRAPDGPHETRLHYFNGTWYFRDAAGVLWGTYYPQLLFKIPPACRAPPGLDQPGLDLRTNG